MIEELHAFFQAVQERYKKTGFITEVTITNEAAQFIPHISPKPGESIELYFPLGRVLIKNGGEPEKACVESGQTHGGHPYEVREIISLGSGDKPTFKKGTVTLPSNQDVEVVWDAHGNVFHIDGWNNHREMFCIRKEDGTVACDVIPLNTASQKAALDALEEKAVLKESLVSAETSPVRMIPHSLREVLNLPDPEEHEEHEEPKEEPKQEEKQVGETVAGYQYMVCGQNTDTGYRFGHVTLPNGETHAAEWDLAGNDTGGRRKFKIEAKNAG